MKPVIKSSANYSWENPRSLWWVFALVNEEWWYDNSIKCIFSNDSSSQLSSYCQHPVHNRIYGTFIIDEMQIKYSIFNCFGLQTSLMVVIVVVVVYYLMLFVPFVFFFFNFTFRFTYYRKTLQTHEKDSTSQCVNIYTCFDG